MSDPFVIVGGDAAGLSAASKFAREAPKQDVVVFEKGSWVSYAHCGMPYYVKGEVDSLEDLLTLTPADIEERGIELRRHHEVTGIDTERNSVTVEAAGGQFEQPYDSLLIATGGHAITAPIEGATLENAFTMHSMDSAAALDASLTPPSDWDPSKTTLEFVDADLVDRYATTPRPETAAIVGGGYVGVEMAEALVGRDLDVHLFQRPDALLPPFGRPVGEKIAATLENHGVTVHLETGVDELRGDERVEAVATDSEVLPVDLALVGIGIRPNTEFLAETAIETVESGAIVTDEYGRTSVDSVYAAGDCAQMEHTVTGEPAWIPLGLTANRAGRAIGTTVAGTLTETGAVAGTAAVKAFDMEAGRTGLIDHEAAQSAGFDPISETITTASRSGYYPGAADTTVTLTADRQSEKLLGGSIVGSDRAAIRIDTLATALDQDMTVGELERLDLAYAPPFSPVWDPILVAAKVLNGRFDEDVSG